MNVNRNIIGAVWWGFVLMLLAAVLLTLAGCTGNRRIETPARAGDQNTRLVTRAVTFVSGRACDLETLQCSNMTWERSGYYQMTDMTDPILVVLDGTQNACPVWANSVRSPRPTEYYQCPTSWRIWRRP